MFVERALVVSQFTLIADTAKGNRPSFGEAAPPEMAEPVYERFCAELRALGVPVETGVFGAKMELELVNDGPVTIVLDDRLAELQERRTFECRLTPERGLATLDEAEEFLRDRGMLTRTADSALPSLFEACHEEPYARASRGFGQWPATKFPWFGELGARGHLILAIHRGKSLLVTDAVAELLDPICRAELARLEAADEDGARLLRHLADAGPSELDDLQTELSLTPKELKQLRSPLERCGAIVARALVYEEPHRHTSLLQRWDQARARSDRREGPARGGRRSHLRRRPRRGRRARKGAAPMVLVALVLGRLPRRRARRGGSPRPQRRPRRRRLRRGRCYTRHHISGV